VPDGREAAARPSVFVFAYGSLVHPDQLRALAAEHGLAGEARLAILEGYRRAWDVAMDNRLDLPGYKFYRDAQTGERPPLRVTFLNIEPASGAWVNGVVLPVSPRVLDALDRRERNYRRVDVTAHLELSLPGTVWAYSAREEALARYRRGLEADTAVIARAYLETVEEGFRRWGAQAYRTYLASTPPPPVPLRHLRRVATPD
jgi:cation transport regulator ChaC